jgi:hypothetical protein
MRIPAVASVISKLMRREMPPEAPAVRKISSGEAASRRGLEECQSEKEKWGCI